MDLKTYNPKDELAIEVARDLLRHLDKYDGLENCKKLCFLAEGILE